MHETEQSGCQIHQPTNAGSHFNHIGVREQYLKVWLISLQAKVCPHSVSQPCLNQSRQQWAVKVTYSWVILACKENKAHFQLRFSDTTVVEAQFEPPD